jgi:hypothetical protein
MTAARYAFYQWFVPFKVWDFAWMAKSKRIVIGKNQPDGLPQNLDIKTK